MQLGMYTDSLGHLPLGEALDVAARIGATGIEIAGGGQSSAPHLDLASMLESEGARSRFIGELESRGLHLAALNCSAWLLHPRTGAVQRSIVEGTIRLAGILGVRTVVTMSGCPGEGPDGLIINWPTYPWPKELVDLQERQWSAVVELWRELGPFAADHGVRVALELHPLQVVYNVPTLLELRDAIGPVVGANLDPSHLFWQRMDPIRAAAALGEAVHHVHLKDTAYEDEQVALAGVLDRRSFDDPAGRAWNFRTLGKGHDAAWWRSFLQALRSAGYDGVLSIEHEDRYVDPVDGVEETARFVQPLIDEVNAARELRTA
jgi:sugar phosphate isomerase/epimerase